MARLKADRLAGELVSAADVERDWTARFTAFRQQVLAIPSRLRDSGAMTKEQAAAFDVAIRETLTDLAQGKPSDMPIMQRAKAALRPKEGVGDDGRPPTS